MGKLYKILVLATFGLHVPTSAFAVLGQACAMQTSTSGDGSKCPRNPDGSYQNPQCPSLCAQVSGPCRSAQSACSSAAAQDEALQAQGAAASQAAAANAAEAQQAKELGNAGNMCSGQDTQNARAANGAPIPGLMDKCAQAAQKCNSAGGDAKAAESGARQASAKATEENGLRSNEAQDMAQRCGQSNQNADKLGKSDGQMPQMPQMGGGGGGDSGLTGSNSNFSPEQSAISSSNGQTVAVAPPTSTDTSTGTTSGVSNESFASGASSAPTSSELGNSAGKAAVAADAKVQGGGSPSAMGSSGSSMAGAPPSAAAPSASAKKDAGYEMNFGGSGKSLLGLRASGEEDANLLGMIPGKNDTQPSAAGAQNAANGAARGPASTNGANVAVSEDGSLFKRVSTCYARVILRGHF